MESSILIFGLVGKISKGLTSMFSKLERIDFLEHDEAHKI